MFSKYEDFVAKFRKACDPFKGQRFETFCGYIKDLPENLKKLALDQGKLSEDDFKDPYTEVKVIRTYQAF